MAQGSAIKFSELWASLVASRADDGSATFSQVADAAEIRRSGATIAFIRARKRD